MLKDLLKGKKSAIGKRWLEEIIATYPRDASAFLMREKDRFANPAGHALREATGAILDGILEGIDAEKICHHLESVIKIRALQDFTPSQAVSFVFLLKNAVREELGDAAGGQWLAHELAEFEKEIDQTALFAFDIFVRCREQLYELRVNEVKRSVSAITKRLNMECPEQPGAQNAEAGQRLTRCDR